MQNKWPELVNMVKQGLKVKIDSRQINPGDVFVALPGSKVNGAKYIPQALEQGASYVLTSSVVDIDPEQQKKVVWHAHPPTALGELAAAYFRTAGHDMTIVGITGTNGKTTVCYLLEHLFSQAGFQVGVMGTINQRWPGYVQEAKLTTPDCWEIHKTLNSMAKDGVHVVFMEVSSHALDQFRVAGINFKAGVFTNLTQDHLDYHEDMEAYFCSKARLFAKECGDLLPVINLDDAYGQRLFKRHAQGLGFALQDHGLDSKNILKGEVLSAGPEGLCLNQEFEGETWKISSSLVGGHNASNLLAVQATGLGLGLTKSHMKVLEDFRYIPGRLEKVPNEQGLHIFVDYAHTPDALENVLQSLSELEFRRILVVFGCGGDRDAQKRPLMGAVVMQYAHLSILTSDNPRHEDPQSIIEQVLSGMNGKGNVIRESKRREAIKLALEEMQPGDALLIAGKGHESYQQLGDQRIPFSDVQVAKEFLQCK